MIAYWQRDVVRTFPGFHVWDGLAVLLSCGHIITRANDLLPDALPCRYCWRDNDPTIRLFYEAVPRRTT